MLQSSAATGLLSLRSALAPLLLGVAAGPTQVGLFRIAQAPQSGFAAASSPVRLILLTEQTRDWERGDEARVLAGVRRYTLLATPLMLVVVPVLFWLMPDLIRLVFGERYLDATDAARLILVAAGIQLAIGWTKSLPGRDRAAEPAPRHARDRDRRAAAARRRARARMGCDRGCRRDARRDGRLRARLGCRVRADPPPGCDMRRGDVKVLIVSGIWPPDVGGPASHSPELAARLHARGHSVEVLTTAAAAPEAAPYPVHWVGRSLPPGVRHAAFALRLARLARRADVVYVNSVLTRGVVGGRAARAGPSSSS